MAEHSLLLDTPQPLPDWLTPYSDSLDPRDPAPDRSSDTKLSLRLLERHIFEAIFDDVLSCVAGGGTVSYIVTQDQRGLDLGRFMGWMRGSPERWDAYREAQAIGAEVSFDRVQAIADGEGSMEDVNRSRLRVETAWKRMAIIDRKRFGEKTSIEVAETRPEDMDLFQLARLVQGSVQGTVTSVTYENTDGTTSNDG
jgi:hypothetical protein